MLLIHEATPHSSAIVLVEFRANISQDSLELFATEPFPLDLQLSVQVQCDEMMELRHY